jgi:hydroxyacylglutathione hydrolase
MLLRRFYDPKLAQASYLVGCTTSGEALVVDPGRDIDPYLQAAATEGVRVAHVTETHIHADFVSGARELAHRAGARLYLSDAGGNEWRYAYAAESGATPLKDGSCFRVGTIEIRVMHVPGHTPEHLAFLVVDTAGATEPMGAFTGDFIFVSDVGRPDLLERAVNRKGTMEQSARQLFHSLQRFRSLPEYLQIWPGHGAGSACGKALGAVPQSTLGYERRFSWAFGIANESDFVRAVLAGQPEPPRYFAHMKRINQAGPRLLGGIPRAARLPVTALDSAMAAGAPVVDTRQAAEFMLAAVPGTLNIPANRSFTTWAGSMLPYDRDFYLVVDDRRIETVGELARDLAGIGLDRLAGYFGTETIQARRVGEGGLQTIPTLTLDQVVKQVGQNDVTVLDVRTDDEWKTGHVPGSMNIPVGSLEERLAEIRRDRPVIAHCQTGARAAIAASLLRAKGFSDVRWFPGGFAEWHAAGNPVDT